MLKRAYPYSIQVNSHIVNSYDDPENIFFQEQYSDLITIEASTWKSHQFVSVDKSENVIGYFSAGIFQKGHLINNIETIRFLKDPKYNITFSKDFAEFFEFLFLYLKYRKIEFGVASISPNREWYRKYVKKYEGRIIGVLSDHFLLIDNSFSDYEMYELSRENFCNNYKKFHSKRYDCCVKKYSLKNGDK